MDERRQPASRWNDLDPDIQRFIERLEIEDINTLKYVASINVDELRGMMKFFRDWRAFGRIGTWFMGSIFAIFMAAYAFGGAVKDAILWFRGGP